MQSEMKRRPDHCPRHPDARVVRTITRKSLDKATEGRKYLLRQYECGNGCGEPLGWEFHRSRREFRSGPGRCEDEDTELTHRMAMYDHEASHNDRMASVFALGATGTFIAGLLGVTTLWGDTPWEFSAATMTVTVVATAIAARVAMNTERKRRPQNPSR